MNTLILTLNQPAILDNRSSGKKASALAALYKKGFRVPEFFVVSPLAFEFNLDNEMQRRWKSLSSADLAPEEGGRQVQKLLEQVRLKAEFTNALKSAALRLGDNMTYAVRSSGCEEDGAKHSFAGQFESYLNVTLEELEERILDVWQSSFSERIIAYRKEQGLSWFCGLPAVIIQRMIGAEVSGVAFSADPISGNRSVCVVEAVKGLGHGLVSGELEADLYRIARDGSLVECNIADKNFAFRCMATPRSNRIGRDNIVKVPVEKQQAKQPVLSAFQYNAVSKLARKCERAFSQPQDIEWSIEKGRLYLLQSRPISTLRNAGDNENAAQTNERSPFLTLWDNSNISESYNGVTTPLTFSFARKAYEHVYLQFCRLMQVPQHKIEANAAVFPCMIGLLRGRVYYNLLNWYRLLSLLPGYSVNRHFMEQMMGVKESVPSAITPSEKAPSWLERLRDLLALFGTIAGLIYRYWRLEKDISRFYSRLNCTLEEDLGRSPAASEISRMQNNAARQESSRSAACNARRYRELERRLLSRWDAPLVNDFFAMIFFGMLRLLCRKWCQDNDGTLHNALVAGQGGLISAEPARRIRTLGSLAAGDQRLINHLSCGNVAELERLLPERPLFEKEYRSYLAKFGDRCLEELKLESKTLIDDPSILLKSIAQAALQAERTYETGNHKSPPSACINPPGLSQDIKSDPLFTTAEQKAIEKLKASPLKRLIFEWVLKNARLRVRDRENLRFERTRLFGRVRRIFLEIGADFAALGVLKNRRDIFYLQVEEILSFVEGTSTTINLKGLVDLRQKEFRAYKQEQEAPVRISTEDLVYHSLQVQGASSAFQHTGEVAEGSGSTDLFLKGTGCCPGVVRGRVRVVLDPKFAALSHGEILVAKRTDPGWIMLFPAASALIVEHGSLLSHSAIVARELGLPAVISVTNATSVLKTGDIVELNGTTGRIEILERGGKIVPELSA